MHAVVGTKHAFTYKELETRALERAPEVFVRGGSPDVVALRFLEQMHEDMVAEDVAGLTLDDLVFLVARFWTWAQERKQGRTKLRLEEGKRADGAPLGRDVLEIVTRDKAFLVDSVMGEINAQGAGVLAMFHPLVTLARDASGRRADAGTPSNESLIQVHLTTLDDAARMRLLAGVRETLEDVEAAVTDYFDMRARMDQAIDELKAATTGASRDELDESIAFLRWLRDDHFAFFGCRMYDFPTSADGKVMNEEPIILEETGRGVLRDPARSVLRRGSEPSILTPAIQDFLREPSPLIIAKSNMRSRIHRRAYMDYIGVKRYRADGEVIGETRFVGLFTAEAYLSSAREVPLVRRKVRRVLERADKSPGSHNYKLLKNIVETYSRDELFQGEEDDLLKISLGILHLMDRPRPRIFIRRDRFDRFASIFAYIPRDRYTTTVREQIGNALVRAFDGRLSAFYPLAGEGPLTRVHFIIGLTPFNHPEPDPAALEAEIAAIARTWEDGLIEALRSPAGAPVRMRAPLYSNAFSAGYRETFDAAEALVDMGEIERMGGAELRVRAYRTAVDAPEAVRLKLYRVGAALPLSSVIPILEAMGLVVEAEATYAVRRAERAENGNGPDGPPPPPVFIHDFRMHTTGAPVAFEAFRVAFEDAFRATWAGANESDGFNALVLRLGAAWRDVAYLRTCARYRQQSGLDPSPAVQEQALASHPAIVKLLLDLRTTRFDPALGLARDARTARQAEIEAELATALDAVASLDHDRVLRRLWAVIAATQRTNFYQRDTEGRPLPHISIKIASRELDDLPAPKPFREIFVWAPHVEGVHLRFGPVARGGLRWSDRRDDFRTEVLGLVKAQFVKNAVIVPVGSKGGFYPKMLPVGGSREELQAEGVRAYTTFLRGLLDITDNLVDGAVSHPQDVVVWDGEDPYLVVAADKGTATFSDIANGIAQSYGYWLDDAFASGGSVGYDHKKMAITARGAWVAVQRHFREIGVDIQTAPFTVAGVGDLSGDVFGNGMLLSRVITLVAAFDHRDIFLDPNPVDLEASWIERKRIFDLPRSSWADYDKSLISPGGGVFSRSLKSIPLSPEVRARLGVEVTAMSPTDLMAAILRADVDLLWFGGIGTYVKAPNETHAQVGDRANDQIRVDATDVRAKVIGEGANLGLTQAGRIALSRKGVRLNTDFIDNAAGVDSSDHEVNIKILLSPIVRAGRMTLADRNRLLASMTDEVAEGVLKHNYDQTLALSLAEASAASDLDAHERLLIRLEERRDLDRKVEGLPSAEQIRALKDQGLGLSRPEIAILISYSKIGLFDRLVASNVPDDPHFQTVIEDYFPTPLTAFAEDMKSHRLRREIISTVLANDMVNLGGPTFSHRARESTGADTDTVARAFQASRIIFGLSTLVTRIHALDNAAPAAAQQLLYEEVVRMLRRQTYWLVRRGRSGEMAGEAATIDGLIASYRPGVEAILPNARAYISPFERERVEAATHAFVEAGAPANLAQAVADLRPLTSTTDVMDVALFRNRPLEGVAALYHRIGDRFDFDRLRAHAGELTSRLHWDRLAVRRLIEDIYADQRLMTETLLDRLDTTPPHGPDAAISWATEAVESFADRHAGATARASETLDELRASGPWTLSKIAIASIALKELASAMRG